MIKEYYYLAKPGIVYGNLITAAAGFFLATKAQVDLVVLLAMLFGIAFVMGSGCVFNNIYDRDIDSRMDRTKNRALVVGSVSKEHAYLYGSVLGLGGFGLLYFFTNTITAIVAGVGFIFYVFIYTPWKRRTVHGTILGSISGAVPPVVGYCAVANKFDLGALLLFLIMVVWQMPHFYSISIFRFDDYKAAGIPSLPIVKGVASAKKYIVGYIFAFLITTTLLTVFSYTGYAYLVVVLAFGLYWLYKGFTGFRANTDDKSWAREMFKVSLIGLLVFCLAVLINVIIKI